MRPRLPGSNVDLRLQARPFEALVTHTRFDLLTGIGLNRPQSANGVSQDLGDYLHSERWSDAHFVGVEYTCSTRCPLPSALWDAARLGLSGLQGEGSCVVHRVLVDGGVL